MAAVLPPRAKLPAASSGKAVFHGKIIGSFIGMITANAAIDGGINRAGVVVGHQRNTDSNTLLRKTGVKGIIAG